MGQASDREISVVLDFGGVLFQTSASEMYKKRFAEQGRSEEDLRYFLSVVFTSKARGEANFGLMSTVTAKLAEQNPEWADEILAFNADRNFIDQVHGTIPGMPELVQELKRRGHFVFGLTNWAADTIRPLKKAYPFLDQLDEIVVSGEEGVKKPNIEIFERAAARYRMHPIDLIFFDDKDNNINAARHAGWRAEKFEGPHTITKALGMESKPPGDLLFGFRNCL